ASRDWLPLRSGLLRNCPCVPHVTSFDQPSASPVGTGILAVLDAERREKKTVATSATHDEPRTDKCWRSANAALATHRVAAVTGRSLSGSDLRPGFRAWQRRIAPLGEDDNRSRFGPRAMLDVPPPGQGAPWVHCSSRSRPGVEPGNTDNPRSSARTAREPAG